MIFFIAEPQKYNILQYFHVGVLLNLKLKYSHFFVIIVIICQIWPKTVNKS